VQGMRLFGFDAFFHIEVVTGYGFLLLGSASCFSYGRGKSCLSGGSSLNCCVRARVLPYTREPSLSRNRAVWALVKTIILTMILFYFQLKYIHFLFFI
jgi:hypothetical protein